MTSDRGGGSTIFGVSQAIATKIFKRVLKQVIFTQTCRADAKCGSIFDIRTDEVRKEVE